MGAGSSSRQRGPEQAPAGAETPAEPEPGSGPSEAAPDPAADPATAAADPATKLVQKNGQLSTVNGLAEQEESTPQEEAQSGQEEEVTVTEVGQREPEDVSKKDLDKDVAANSVIVEDVTKDQQEEMPGVTEQIPSSESHLEKLTRSMESQPSDAGEANIETGEAAAKESEEEQSVEKAEDTLKHQQRGTEISLTAESSQAAVGGKDEGEATREKEPTKSPESPTSPVTSETTSTFKKFFTQGWAGWRKKTSFRKPKEEELEASEKKKEQEPAKADTEENEKAEDTPEQLTASEQSQKPAEGTAEARLSADYEKVELPLEDQVSGARGSSAERCAPLATEVFDEKVEAHQEVVAEVHVSSAEKKSEEQEAEVGETVESLPPETLVETSAEEAPKTEPSVAVEKTQEAWAAGGDHARPTELSPDGKVSPRQPESIVSEAAMLSSQEKAKAQGSPLKKLFSSSGLKKLSGKKQKGRRGGGGGGDEESGDNNQGAAESPDSADEKGESSASSPEEPEEITCLEKGIPEGPHEGEAEEGAASDGEKKREGVTPWASFKKMVTPKKRVRRPSESDKEDELDKLDKAKSATLSSTESAASEMQEEIKGAGEEQKPEEPKRKVDTSVSWEVLICVGSSKKRARKASSSDDEGGPKTIGGDGPKAEEAARDKETATDSVLAGAQEPEQGQGSSSPEPAGSPSEGEGVSTWESFKRLVTPRKKPKSKQEEKNEESGGVEHSASDVEPGKEESWVSIKKFIPGRRKKRLDGKQEQAAIGDSGPAEINEEDPDVPAVVPLSEYDAVEREKMEALQAAQSQAAPEQQGGVDVSEELCTTLAPCATGAVTDGTRAVASVEERSPSWISASVTQPLEAQDEAIPPSGEVAGRDIVAGETPTATQTPPESRDAPEDTGTTEAALTSEAVATTETTEVVCAEEATEASAAEETTEMVSAVSQLTDSPDTTEEATPVQEVESGGPDAEEQRRQTQAVLQAVAEKVKEKTQLPDSSGAAAVALSEWRAELKALEKVEEAEEDSEASGLKEEVDVVLKVNAQETGTDHVSRGEVIAQAAPEGGKEVPHVAASREPSELVTEYQLEPLPGLQPPEQPVLPDSADTLTDNETNGSTPVADVEAVGTIQQDEVIERQDDSALKSDTQSQVTEVAPAQKEGSSVPPSLQCQEEYKEQLKLEEVPEHADQELSVEATIPIISKTELIQEATQLAGGEAKDRLGGKELVASPQVVSQEEATEVPVKGELTEGAECQKSANTELQSPGLGEGERVAQVEKEETDAKAVLDSEEKAEQKSAGPRAEGLGQQPLQMANVCLTDGEKEVGSLEGSSLPPPDPEEEAGCLETREQSSEAPVTVTPVAEEEVLGDTRQISEIGDAVEPAGSHLEPAKTSPGKDGDRPSQPGDDAIPVEAEPQVDSEAVTVSPTPEKDLHTVLEGEDSGSQKQKAADGEHVSHQAVSPAADGSPMAESQMLQLESESSKLVQDIIQTAVDQFVRTEETASAIEMETPPVPADSQGAVQSPVEEASGQQAPVQAEIQTVATLAEPEPAAVAPGLSDISKDVNGASEETLTTEVGGSGVSEPSFEEVAESEGTGGKPTATDSCAEPAERTDKSPLESKEDEKGDAVEDRNSALADAPAPGGLTRESPDTNGPKLTEEEAGAKGGKVHSESEKDIRPQAEEEQRGGGREPAEC